MIRALKYILIFIAVYLASTLSYSFKDPKYEYVKCPDGYAIRLKSGHYVACENYDAMQISIENKEPRVDLLLMPVKN